MPCEWKSAVHRQGWFFAANVLADNTCELLAKFDSVKGWVSFTSRFEEFGVHDRSCEWDLVGNSPSPFQAGQLRSTGSQRAEPRAQHVKAWTDLGDSGAHPLILCACQEKGVKTSWGAGMAQELPPSLSSLPPLLHWIILLDIWDLMRQKCAGILGMVTSPLYTKPISMKSFPRRSMPVITKWCTVVCNIDNVPIGTSLNIL